MTVYMAGKVHGPKWEMFKHRPDINMVATDQKGTHYGPHNVGETCLGGKGDIPIHDYFWHLISRCRCMIALIDTADCYGTIAEMAATEALRIPVHAFFIVPKGQGKKFIDAYWFVAGMVSSVNRVRTMASARKHADGIVNRYQIGHEKWKGEAPTEGQMKWFAHYEGDLPKTKWEANQMIWFIVNHHGPKIGLYGLA
jgi:hypothetical protein